MHNGSSDRLRITEIPRAEPEASALTSYPIKKPEASSVEDRSPADSDFLGGIGPSILSEYQIANLYLLQTIRVVLFAGVKELVNLCRPISSGLYRPVAIEIHDHQRLMDPSQPHTTLTIDVQQEDDEWDTDGFVIPSLGIEDTYQTKPDASEVETLKSPPPKAKLDENIYLGPHGAPPSQSKQQELSSSGRKQRFKQKLKEADKKVSRIGRENKLENLRELVGGGKVTQNMAKSSPRDWLDPHCNESQFEKCPR
ncbi:hypothetical protein DKX38_025538 [Salix brachista]|uniref:Uncharacterized protein n=3 Tax=Salix TaxID=40685 RepID=A0A5N5JPS3_9ROSI|nr:hypothetical protein DKX38_025538 [Salix brachista]